MANTLLGVDVGHGSLKLALVSGGQVKKAVTIPMPNSLVKDGRTVSGETMGELIRNTMKEYGIRCSKAALVLHDDTVFIRTVSTPLMTSEQLLYNLPFEFRDYITDELKNYYYDYAVLSGPDEAKFVEDTDIGEGQSESTLEVMALAAPISLIEESRTYLRKAGLKLVKAAPAVCCYMSVLRRLEESGAGYGEYCILDLGYQSIRMYMFSGDRHIATRVLEIGLSTLDDVIADAYNVDVHLAHTYLLSNYDSCQYKEFCTNAYGNITVELMRALNFYRFSNRDSNLSDIWICGGGARIEPLRENIAQTLDMRIHDASELIPYSGMGEDACDMVQAVGATLD